MWDTVGALGIPNNLAILNLLDNIKRYAFHDTELGCNVIHARHAVAIDEKRASFSPTLWSNVQKRKRVKQIWFPGVHSNVGGGYIDTGLSDIALKWMIDEAVEAGLNVREDMSRYTPIHWESYTTPQAASSNVLDKSPAVFRQS